MLFGVDAEPVGIEEIRESEDEVGEEALLLAEDGNRCVFCARVDARTHVRPGASITLSLDPGRFHFFDPESGLTIGERATTAAPA